MNPRVLLSRGPSTPDGIIGRVLIPETGWSCRSLERPSTGEHPCVPPGLYECKWMSHYNQGMRYELQNVPGRTYILIHPANVYEQLLGCIALGEDPGMFTRDGIAPGVPSRAMVGLQSSKATVEAFEAQMKADPFWLEIR